MALAQEDARFMRLALTQARRGVGRTAPNPPVGAVVVRNGVVVGRGFHRRAGDDHGEVAALRDAGNAARGATLYVTLEPCAHHGRTPPCSEAVIAAGIRRVVIGSIDPNPKVPGGGRHKLSRAGIAVSTGVLKSDCDDLVAAFGKHITCGLPLVTLKLATSLDGRIATAGGDSRWITGEDARRYAHRLRNEHDAILVGAQTVLRDDPQLTCRLRGGRNPIRVVIDGRLRIPLSSQLVRTTDQAPTLVFTSQQASEKNVAALRALGVEVIRCRTHSSRLRLRDVMRRLGQRGILSVLVEGGANVASQLLQEQLVDRLLIFLAPKLIGGDGRPTLDSLGVQRMSQAIATGPLRVRRFAVDLLLATHLVSRP